METRSNHDMSIPTPSTLKFVRREQRYSVYQSKRDGETVYLEHVTRRRLANFNDLADTGILTDRFITWCNVTQVWAGDHERQQEWLTQHLRADVFNPERIDEYAPAICRDCLQVHWLVAMTTALGDRLICSTCITEYVTCAQCGGREHQDEATGVAGGWSVCESCRDTHYSWCEHCDTYYHHNHRDQHRHIEGDNCCESPAMRFAIRNDGHEPLREDTRVSVSLPTKTISDEGMWAIQAYLQSFYYPQQRGADLLQEERNNYHYLGGAFRNGIGDEWQTKKGNFTKRLSRYAYQNWSLKLPPEVMSTVGNLARQHSNGSDFHLEITRNLNLPPEDFAHEESCWWQSYSSSRCALKTNGGFALRTFTNADPADDEDYDDVAGRAWVLPLRHDPEVGSDVTLVPRCGDLSCRGCDKVSHPIAFAPTFDTTTADAFVVFNGYGNLSDYAPARVLAQMLGVTYRKVGFQAPPMYVNNGGYLVAREEIAAEWTDKSIYLALNTHSDLFDVEQEAAAHQASTIESLTAGQTTTTTEEHAHVA